MNDVRFVAVEIVFEGHGVVAAIGGGGDEVEIGFVRMGHDNLGLVAAARPRQRDGLQQIALGQAVGIGEVVNVLHRGQCRIGLGNHQSVRVVGEYVYDSANPNRLAQGN